LTAGEIVLYSDTYSGYNMTLQDNAPSLDVNIINDVTSAEVFGESNHVLNTNV
jgi:hypothetical protein